MIKSVLFRRIVTLVLSAVLLSGVLSSGIYIFAAGRIYAEIRAKELLPVAHVIAESGFFNMRQNIGAELSVFDMDGEPLRIGDLGVPGGAGRGSNPRPTYADTIPSADVQAVLSGKEVSHIVGRMLIVGVPIETGGAVFLAKPLNEISDTLNVLNRILLISTLTAFIIMLVPAYFLARRLVVPIRQMRNAAHAMADGDFTVRADETVKGEIGELAVSVNHFVTESERLEQTRRDYVANVSHELRTPIASIRAMGETLRDGMVKSDGKRELFYNNIVRESLRLSRLVDDLLELSRLQAGNEAIVKSRLDLREVISNISDGYGHLIEDASITFTVNADMSSPMYVNTNADRIEQVLVILIDNAIKHTPDGGTICLTASRESMTVENSGEPIGQDDLPYIFDRFYTAEKSHSNSSGLGLSIAKEIVRSLGGTIQAESDESGTRFTFTFGSL